MTPLIDTTPLFPKSEHTKSISLIFRLALPTTYNKLIPFVKGILQHILDLIIKKRLTRFKTLQPLVFLFG